MSVPSGNRDQFYRAPVASSLAGRTLPAVKGNAGRLPTIYTDNASTFDTLAAKEYIHDTVNHVEEYVRGQVHTQGIENFWSLLKRGLKGTYIAVEPFHLDRYVTEQVFRYNNRATRENPLNDADRFAKALSQVAGRRLTYRQLTGKQSNEP